MDQDYPSHIVIGAPGASWPHLRRAMAQEFAELSDERLSAEFSHRHSGLDIDAAENFLRDLGRGLSTAARHVGQALPGLASGALTGLMAGGPIGALVGAGAGLGTGLAGSIGREVRGPGGQVLQTIGNLGQTAMGLVGGGKAGLASGLLGALPGLLGGGRGGQSGNPLAGLLGSLLGGRAPQQGLGGAAPAGGAAQQLLALLGRPEMLQALSSSMLGPMGRQTIPIAAQTAAGRMPLTQAPTGALLGLLGQQVQEALDEWASHAAETPLAHEYLMQAQPGENADPADPVWRAQILREWFAAAELIERAAAEQMPGQVHYAAHDAGSDEGEAFDDSFWPQELDEYAGYESAYETSDSFYMPSFRP